MAKETERKVEFLLEAPDTTGQGDIEWIGFRTTSISGEEKNFLWWKNPDVPIEVGKGICDLLMVKHGIEAKIGPAVDLARSKEDGIVCLIDSEGAYGIYVEAESRPHLTHIMMITTLLDLNRRPDTE